MKHVEMDRYIKQYPDPKPAKPHNPKPCNDNLLSAILSTLSLSGATSDNDNLSNILKHLAGIVTNLYAHQLEEAGQNIDKIKSNIQYENNNLTQNLLVLYLMLLVSSNINKSMDLLNNATVQLTEVLNSSQINITELIEQINELKEKLAEENIENKS